MTLYIIDNREPDKGANLRLPDGQIVNHDLAGGDVAVLTGDSFLVFERKTVEDFMASIKDGRLERQCLGMRGLSAYRYVVVVGDVEHTSDGYMLRNGYRTEMPIARYNEMIETVQAWDVHVVPSTDFEKTVQGIVARHENDPKEVLVRPTVPMRYATPGENILLSLPQIGQERTKFLAKQYKGRVGHALADLSSGEKIWPEIPYKASTDIRDAFGLDPDEILVVINRFTGERIVYRGE